MPRSKLSAKRKKQIDEFIDSLYFDVQAAGGQAKLSEEYVVKLVTKFLVSLCTAIWSISEILDYIKERKEFKNLFKST